MAHRCADSRRRFDLLLGTLFSEYLCSCLFVCLTSQLAIFQPYMWQHINVHAVFFTLWEIIQDLAYQTLWIWLRTNSWMKHHPTEHSFLKNRMDLLICSSEVKGTICKGRDQIVKYIIIRILKKVTCAAWLNPSWRWSKCVDCSFNLVHKIKTKVTGKTHDLSETVIWLYHRGSRLSSGETDILRLTFHVLRWPLLRDVDIIGLSINRDTLLIASSVNMLINQIY